MAKDNQQPSLSGNTLEGSTTRTYRPDREMKSIDNKCYRSAEHPLQGDDIVSSAWKHVAVSVCLMVKYDSQNMKVYMNHYAYLLTFPDGMKYVGARSTNLDPNLDTCYLGSGGALPPDRKDLRDVEKVILAVFSSREELMEFEKNFILNNGCVESTDWYNQRTATFDRHGSEPWNKGKTGISTGGRETYKRRYSNGYRTPAQIAGAASMREKLTGISNPAKGHHGTDNSGFTPWYYITPDGDYVEVHDKTKGDMAGYFGVTQRQIINRFHYSNEHKQAKYPTLRGYTFGNLPRPTSTAED